MSETTLPSAGALQTPQQPCIDSGTGSLARRSGDTRALWRRWGLVSLYAVAMAWVEAAVVLYLRTLVGRMDPYQRDPLPLATNLAKAEVVREACTLLMLFAVGWLAGRTWRGRLGFSLLAFGVWDIFYYVFLIPLTGWPRSLLDWDILFLIPLPWWGPVLAPMLIALLMILGGTLLAFFNDSQQAILWPSRRLLALCLAGGFLALYVFMADAIPVAGEGVEALSKVLPARFNWPLYLVALGMMAAPVVELWWRARGGGDHRSARGASTEPKPEPAAGLSMS